MEKYITIPQIRKSNSVHSCSWGLARGKVIDKKRFPFHKRYIDSVSRFMAR